ncbi:MAG: hypothetical protein EA406_13310 [Rhodospirillales bacterium]|nr:MAG: hypothetical protein EA406_13310 [Rhodospirillales bacterium]
MRLPNKRALAAFVGLAAAVVVAWPSCAVAQWRGVATEVTQLRVLVQQIAQVQHMVTQLQQGAAMLESFGLNSAAEIVAAAGELQGVLRQSQSLMTQINGITQELDDLYPGQIDPDTPLAELVRLARRQLGTGRDRLVESANIQAGLFKAMEQATARDGMTLNASAAAPGVTAAVQATNELVAALNNDVRALQLATIAHYRTVEDRHLREHTAEAEAIARWCWNMRRMPGFQDERCQ